MEMPWNPAASKTRRNSLSSQAPEIQPDHSSGSVFMCAGTTSSLTMSEIAAFPPFFRTRKISAIICVRFSSPTRLRTQLDTTTSTDASGIIGSVSKRCFQVSNSCASATLATGFARRYASTASRSVRRSWMYPLWKVVFFQPTRSATVSWCRRARASMSSVMSTPCTRPVGPTIWLAM